MHVHVGVQSMQMKCAQQYEQDCQRVLCAGNSLLSSCFNQRQRKATLELQEDVVAHGMLHGQDNM